MGGTARRGDHGPAAVQEPLIRRRTREPSGIESIQVVATTLFLGVEPPLDQGHHRDEEREEGDHAEAEEGDVFVRDPSRSSDSAVASDGERSEEDRRRKDGDQGCEESLDSGIDHDWKSSAADRRAPWRRHRRWRPGRQGFSPLERSCDYLVKPRPQLPHPPPGPLHFRDR